MGFDAPKRHRRLGALALLVALAMLVAGVTVLKPRLQGLPCLLYWLACLALTLFALFTALLDVRAVRHRIREEQRGLLDDTIGGIEKDARSKRPRSFRRK